MTKLVRGGLLAGDQDEYQAANATRQRTDDQRQKRALQAKERADHRHHLHIAKTHAFAPPQQKVDFRHQPDCPGSDACAQRGFDQR